MLGVGKIKKSTTDGYKREKKVQLQASNRGTRGLGKLIGEGRPRWEKGVVGKLATLSHAPTHDASRRLKNMRVLAYGSLFDVGVSTGR